MDEFIPLNLFSNEDESVLTDHSEEISSPSEESTDDNEFADTDSTEGSSEDTIVSSAETDEDSESNDEAEKVIVSVSEEANSEDREDVEPQSDKLDKVLYTQQQLMGQIESLNNLFNTRIMHTDHEEKIVDQMHKELQKYREDMYAQLVRPILLDVIEVRDSIMRMAATYLAKPDGEQNIPNKTFSDYAFDLQDILEKNDVEIYRSKSGDDFTPIRQRAVKKVATSDESLHGKIAESLSCGYSYNGRTISAEKITVYFYDESIKKNENSEVIENG